MIHPCLVWRIACAVAAIAAPGMLMPRAIYADAHEPQPQATDGVWLRHAWVTVHDLPPPTSKLRASLPPVRRLNGEQAPSSRRPIDPARVLPPLPPRASPAGSLPSKVTAVKAFAAAEAVDKSGPADVQGAVGVAQVVVATNHQVRIFDRQGVLLKEFTIDDFWKPAGLPQPFDPSLAYDPHAGRWVMVVDSLAGKSNAIGVAVSQGEDALGKWHQVVYAGNVGTNGWQDQPVLGISKRWLLVSCNPFTFGGAALGGYLWVIDRAALYAGGDGKKFKLFSSATAYSLTPSIDLDGTAEDATLMMMWNPDGWFKAYRVWGEVGAEAMEELGLVKVPFTWIAASQLGTNQLPQAFGGLVSANDARLQRVWRRHGSLWFAQTVFEVVAKGKVRGAVQWIEADPMGKPIAAGGVVDEAGTYHYAFGSMAPNSAGDMMIGYSRFASSEYISAGYTFRPADHAATQAIAQAGKGSATLIDDKGRNRWGDYSATVPDPVFPSDLWTFQAYAAKPSAAIPSHYVVEAVHLSVDLPLCGVNGACPGKSHCSEGKCVGQGGIGTTCAAAAECSSGYCAQGVCCDSACTANCGVCSAANGAAVNGFCSPKPGPCDDGDPCTVNDTCSGGTCLAGNKVMCDDANVCTFDKCDFAKGCQHTTNALSCDDGDGCTVLDTCSDGVCKTGAPLACYAANACHKPGVCKAGLCNPVLQPDGHSCPGGRCKAGACIAEPADAPRSDTTNPQPGPVPAPPSADPGCSAGPPARPGASLLWWLACGLVVWRRLFGRSPADCRTVISTGSR